MEILVFGGTFDPPHRGHAALLRAAAKRIKPDRVLIVPAFQAPLKGAPQARAADRLAMIKLGLVPKLPKRYRKRTVIELSELSSRRRVYTVDTLKRLRKLNATARLHFAVGLDGAAAFSSWKNPGQLKRLSRWWTAMRPGQRKSPPAFFNILRAKMPAICSTAVRRSLALNEPLSKELAPAVSKYIRRHGLYGLKTIAELERMLKPRRFEHVQAVARLADALARRWGQDPQKALLAALLHDCGRSVPADQMPAQARKHRVAVPAFAQIERRNPTLLHAYLSADIARRRFKVQDPAVLGAISKHTLGAARMSALDRLLYVADSCSEDRRYRGVARLRKLAFRDLDEAFCACVQNKIRDAVERGGWLHPTTVTLWNSLLA